MIAKETNLPVIWFATIFFSGFLLANSILICASFIPLFIYLVGFFVAPLEVEIKRTGLPRSARLGEIVEIEKNPNDEDTLLAYDYR